MNAIMIQKIFTTKERDIVKRFFPIFVLKINFVKEEVFDYNYLRRIT